MATSKKANKKAAAAAVAAANAKEVDEQMQQVLQLLSARTKGQATNEQVEKAVSKILTTAGLGPPPTQGSNNTKKTEAKQKKPVVKEVQAQIQVDTEDYDFDDEGEEEKKPAANSPATTTTGAATSSTHTNTSIATTTTTNIVVLPSGNRKRKRSTNEDKQAEEERKRQYEEIPLGQQGAHMMTSFGDGPCPIPETVSATLLGARRLLQVTIQDARALKRQNKQQFKKAQVEVAKYVKKKKQRKVPDTAATADEAEEADSAPTGSSAAAKKQQKTPEALPNPDMLYRAFLGYDKLARDAKCGFNFEQLKSLFPEEMRAYTRWNNLKDEYQKNSNEKEQAVEAEEREKEGETAAATTTTTTTTTTSTSTAAGVTEPAAPEEGVDDTDDDGNDEDPIKDGGHLLERAVQFDLRTNLMDQGWYLKFAEHRKGSFLPRRIREAGDLEWKENQKMVKEQNRDGNSSNNNNGNNKKPKETGVWAHMSAKSARFLHWVGFDPDKGLPPPNDETTQALAFLGYDFMGRIVEKAIFLKNLAKAKQSNDEVDERTILLELEDGEQLKKADIDLAMQDIRPAAMYSTKAGITSEQKAVAQLYFGPGFEERVEMELDELMCASDSAKRDDLSEEELKIRKKEDKLFARMAELPTTTNAVKHLLGTEGNDKEENANRKSQSLAQSKPIKRRRARIEIGDEEAGQANEEAEKDTDAQPKKRKRGPIKRKELKEWGEALAG